MENQEEVDGVTFPKWLDLLYKSVNEKRPEYSQLQCAKFADRVGVVLLHQMWMDGKTPEWLSKIVVRRRDFGKDPLR